jgi:hypothetical protein
LTGRAEKEWGEGRVGEGSTIISDKSHTMKQCCHSVARAFATKKMCWTLDRGILSNAKITSWSNKFSFHRLPLKV